MHRYPTQFIEATEINILFYKRTYIVYMISKLENWDISEKRSKKKKNIFYFLQVTQIDRYKFILNGT